MFTRLVPLILIFSAGGCVGHSMTDEPPPEFVKVPHTVIVHDDPPAPKTVYRISSDCLQSLRYAGTITAAADRLYASSEVQLRILSDARRALASDGDLNAIEDRQRNLQGREVGALDKAEESLSRFHMFYDSCKKEQQ